MGGKPSIFIQTPTFNQNEWKYLSNTSESSDEYGMFRTLLNEKTGQKIDEYDFSWPSKEQYQYYLKSFNWRYQQNNVVNTKFFVECTEHQICSRNYTAQVYIEHMLIRLSDVSDIPFPDNLYVLMECLEGYSQIYEHSKYFRIEQNQICVDEKGHIKVWVNGDLSINYPNMAGVVDQQSKTQEDMVDEIVNIITDNTDTDTEPSPTFRDYFDLNKGENGRNFEETKGLVLSYAKQNRVDIPARFQAVLNLDKEEQSEFKPTSESNLLNPNNGQQNSSNLLLTPVRKLNERVINITNNNPPMNSYYPPAQMLKFGNCPPIHIQPPFSYQPMPPIFYQQPPPYYQVQPILYSPRSTGQPVMFVNRAPFPAVYVQNPQPIYQNNQNNQSIPLLRINSIKNNNISANKNTSVDQYSSQPQRISKKQSSPNQSSKILGAAAYSVSSNKIDHSDQYELPQKQSQNGESDPEIHIEQQFSHESQHKHKKSNHSKNDKSMSISEEDDVAIRSLPIKAGYPSNTNQHLTNLRQNKRQAYSNITSKEAAWQFNYDSFGLGDNSQKRLRENQFSPQKQSRHNNMLYPSKNHNERRSMKYFVTLDQELEIDPDIAADMIRYLS